jgi:hypothetical protein
MKVADLDIVYLSYDEPNAEALFAKLQKISPRPPMRVHGVKGFDAAHKQAAMLAHTPRFIIVDGDNVVRKEFFKMQIDDRKPADVVLSFTALNGINGLAYGNGGVKIWPRDLLLAVDTHERGKGNDFCWTFRYWQMPEIVSDVCMGSAHQAFRSSYREAVKLSLVKEKKLDWAEARQKIYPPNLSRLLIWATVGADIKYGNWSIYGARCGLEHVWIDAADLDLIRDYDWFKKRVASAAQHDHKEQSVVLGKRLEKALSIDLPNLTASESRWFKAVFWNPPRQGLMVRDMKPPRGREI